MTGNWQPGDYYRLMGYNTGKQIQFNYNDGTWISDNNSIRFGCGGSQGTGGVYVERMRITNSGNVGIRTTTPVVHLDFGTAFANRVINLYGVGGNSASTVYYGFGINNSTLRYNVMGTGDVHRFYGGSTQYGYVNHGTGFISTFTGQHKSFPHETLFGKASEDLCGLIVSASGEHISINDSVPQKGQGAIQVSEAIPTVKLSVSEKDKTVFGVVSDVEDMETSQRRDHYGAFVSTFEKELGDSRIYVNSIGEGAVWVTDINGPLESVIISQHPMWLVMDKSKIVNSSPITRGQNHNGL